MVITGATGFIGRHLRRRLSADGYEVWAVTRQVMKARDDSVRWVQGDVTDADAVNSMVQRLKPGLIVHLASVVHGSRDRTAVSTMLEANTWTTVHLLQAAAALTGCRVVLAGSIEEPRVLDSTVGAHSPYAAAKVAATAFATYFRDTVGVPVTVLRLSMVYGPDQPDETKLIPYVVTSLLAGRPPVVGSGTRSVDWIYVDDVVEAFLAALVAEPGAVVDIGSGTGTPISAVVDEIARLVHTTVQVTYGGRADPVGERAHLADPREADRRLGWRARTPLVEGLHATVAWYRSRVLTSASGTGHPDR